MIYSANGHSLHWLQNEYTEPTTLVLLSDTFSIYIYQSVQTAIKFPLNPSHILKLLRVYSNSAITGTQHSSRHARST